MSDLRTKLLQRLESLERAGVQQLARKEALAMAPPAVESPATETPATITPVAKPVMSNPPAPTSTQRAPSFALSDETPRPITTPPASPTRSASFTPAAASSPAGANSLISLAYPTGGPESQADRAAALTVLSQEVAGCVRCQELAATRTQTVFGVGNPNARLCFFGEAPGADEDRQGEPFVGRAGQLLTDMITKGMKLNREDVFILNVLKCRPPGNRTPLPDEVCNCRHFFERQYEILRPEFICCLGAVAAHSLLETETPVGRLRKKWHTYRDSRVIVTYHPAYLLRTPAAKADTWEDLKMLMGEMGLAVPGK